MRKKGTKQNIIAVIVIALALLGGVAFALVTHDTEVVNDSVTPVAQETPEVPQKPAYEPIDLQPIVDTWAQKYPADYSISILDLQSDTVIAQSNPDKPIFAASIYKLYVAYVSLIDFQTGGQNPDEVITAGQTKKQCVDKMIRESDSPCGESMMADIGQSNLNARVTEFGLTNTKFNGITTSANDATKTLSLIEKSDQLNNENRAFLKDAMLNQPAKFKRGLQTGAPDAKWYTKVGWNEDINYHDVGIMELADGRKFAVAIFGQGSGASAPIADFSKTIYQALNN